jgi:hypothetical protein
MGRRGGGRGAGGGRFRGCALLAAAFVVSTFVIQGAGGTYVMSHLALGLAWRGLVVSFSSFLWVVLSESRAWVLI